MIVRPKNPKTEKPKNRTPFLGFSVFPFFGPRSGFTLVEILIVATIVSVIAAGLGSSFVAGMRLWGRAHQRDAVHVNALLTLELMAKELRQSVAVPFAQFTGEAHELSFPAVINEALVQVTYVYDPYDNALRREEVGLKGLLEDMLEPETRERALLSSAEEVLIEFAAFDATPDDDGQINGYDWSKTSWEEDDGIPAAIRLTIKTRNATLTKLILLPITLPIA